MNCQLEGLRHVPSHLYASTLCPIPPHTCMPPHYVPYQPTHPSPQICSQVSPGRSKGRSKARAEAARPEVRVTCMQHITHAARLLVNSAYGIPVGGYML